MREKKKLVWSVSAANYGHEGPGLFAVFAESTPAKFKRLRSEVEQVFESLRRRPVPHEEVSRAKRMIESAWLQGFETYHQQASTIGIYALDGQLDRLETLPAQDHCRHAGPAGRHRGAVFEYVAARAVPWSERRDGLSSAPGSTNRVLPNGLTGLYRQSPGIPLAAGTLFLRTGSSYERPDQAGLASLTAELMLSGTRRRSSRQLAETIESVGASLGAQVSEDYTEIGHVAPRCSSWTGC